LAASSGEAILVASKDDKKKTRSENQPVFSHAARAILTSNSTLGEDAQKVGVLIVHHAMAPWLRR
jgi:hypothetical protein